VILPLRDHTERLLDLSLSLKLLPIQLMNEVLDFFPLYERLLASCSSISSSLRSDIQKRIYFLLLFILRSFLLLMMKLRLLYAFVEFIELFLKHFLLLLYLPYLPLFHYRLDMLLIDWLPRPIIELLILHCLFKLSFHGLF